MRRPGPESRSSPRRIRAAQLELAVLPLRLERVTFQAIAEEFHVDRSTAKRAADRALERIKDAASAKAKQLAAQQLAEARAGRERALRDYALATTPDATYKAALCWRIFAEREAAIVGLDRQKGHAWEAPPPPLPAPEAGTTVRIGKANILVVPVRDLARRIKQLKPGPA